MIEAMASGAGVPSAQQQVLHSGAGAAAQLSSLRGGTKT